MCHSVRIVCGPHGAVFISAPRGFLLNTYLAVGLAICSATTFGLFSVMARKAMNMGSALTASIISVLVAGLRHIRSYRPDRDGLHLDLAQDRRG